MGLGGLFNHFFLYPKNLKKNIDLSGKRIILVDDVFTTGTTVNEVSRVLKEGGASKVAVLTAARAI